MTYSESTSMRPWRAWRPSRLITLALLVTCSAACSRTLPPPQVVVRSSLQCLKTPPPEFPDAANQLTKDGCPVGLVCMPESAAIALALYLRAAMAWMAMAWTLGGPLPKDAPIPHHQEG
jgi:hypothetical protein